MTVKKNNESDREVWHRYMTGNNQAMAELVNKYHSRLVVFLAARKCAQPEDTCQDIWSKVIAKKQSFDGKSFSGWVHAIARNAINEQFRKANRRQESNLSPEYDVANDNDIVGLARLEQKEMLVIVKKCMDSVGEPFVTAFRMKLDGSKSKDIAKAIGVAAKTVDTRIYRAKQKIKDCVAGKSS